jgi:hypothetical protein
MKLAINKKSANTISVLILIIFLLCFCIPTSADSPYTSYTSMEVTPTTITFTITNNQLDQNMDYYEADNPITITSSQQFAPISFWFVGIQVEKQFLENSFNPSTRIPISQLRWSKDGVNFTSLSNKCSLVSAYFDIYSRKHTETITYRLYTNGSILPAGSFSAQINFESSLKLFPGNK